MVQNYGFNPYQGGNPILNYNPQAITPYTPSEQTSTSGSDPYLESLLEGLNKQQSTPSIRPQTEMDQRSFNIADNALKDLQQIGTGLVSTALHPADYILKPLGREATKIGNILYPTGKISDPYMNGNALKAVGQLGKDAFNFLGSTYDVNTGDIKDILQGKQSVGQVLGRAATNAYAHPVFTALDVLGAKGLAKTDKIGKYAVKDVERAKQALQTGETLPKGSKAKEVAKKISKSIDDYAGETDEVTRIGLRDQAIANKIKQSGKFNVDEVDNLLNEYKTVDEEVSALANQPISTFDAEDLAKFANEGDKLAGEILDSMAQYDEGYLKALPNNVDDIIQNTLGNVSAGRKVENAINVQGSKITSKMYKVADEMKKVGKFTDDEITGAIRALETGESVTGRVKDAAKALSKAVDKYDDAIPEWARVDTKELAINQKLVRDGFATTIAEADKLLKSYDLAEIPKLANKGDKVAQSIAKGIDSYNSGYLKVVPHGLAEVSKAVSGATDVENMARNYFGKYSTRAWGNAAYGDITNQLRNFDEFADLQTKQWIEEAVTKEMMEQGTLGGRPLVSETTKKVKYIEPVGEGEKVNLTHSIETASDSPLSERSIAVDADVLKELRDQFNVMRDKPFGSSLLQDLYTIGKSNLLASGGYLAGNLQTGLANSLANVGLNPVAWAKDLGAAIQTKGQLAKEAGIFRKTVKTGNRVQNKALNIINKVANAPVADALNTVDAKIQNLFSEMALHRGLTNKGVQLSERANAIKDMGKVELANTIHDAKLVSLVNPSRTILPRQLHGIASLSNPFWKWMDTAAQSSIHMFNKSPMLADIVLNHFAGNIAFDQEMQNRFNMGVTSDKPFVSYRYNPATKQLQEVSAEFIPQMNTLKLVGELGQNIKDGNLMKLGATFGTEAVPIFADISAALKGKNKYGKPLVRSEMDRQVQKGMKAIYNGERYEYKPEEGWVKKEGGYADEVLATAINDLTAYPRLMNRTVAPMATGIYNALTGDNVRYYKPYAHQVFGEFGRAGQMPEYANPRSSAAGQEFMDIMSGLYTQYYNPNSEVQRPSKTLPRQIMKGMSRRMGLDQQILNQYLGGNQ